MIEKAVTNCAGNRENANGIAIPTARPLVLAVARPGRNAIIMAVMMMVGMWASSDSFKNCGKYSL